MKKILIISLLFIILSGCCKKEEKIDYSKYSFTNIKWIRETESDTETISFDSNGGFHYSCACGNPVNDSDLCESYTYDDNKKEIKLNCFETTDDTIQNIIIISQNDNSLELDFDGDKRVFIKE